jgi:hypothetical protein
VEELLQNAIQDFDPQVKTWLTTASNDELIALWSTRYGEGWRRDNLKKFQVNSWKADEIFDICFASEMLRRNLLERHHHMAEQVTLYKLKCKS